MTGDKEGKTEERGKRWRICIRQVTIQAETRIKKKLFDTRRIFSCFERIQFCLFFEVVMKSVGLVCFGPTMAYKILSSSRFFPFAIFDRWWEISIKDKVNLCSCYILYNIVSAIFSHVRGRDKPHNCMESTSTKSGGGDLILALNTSRFILIRAYWVPYLLFFWGSLKWDWGSNYVQWIYQIALALPHILLKI